MRDAVLEQTGLTKMISKQVKWICRDYTEIENYNEAISDTTQIWTCHHKKEIEDCKNVKQLKEEGLYYNRPSEELVFLRRSEHIKLHRLNDSEETRKKRIDNHVGMKGKQHSEETKLKMSRNHVGMKGKHFSEEARRKMSEAHKKSFQNKNKPKGV